MRAYADAAPLAVSTCMCAQDDCMPIESLLV